MNEKIYKLWNELIKASQNESVDKSGRYLFPDLDIYAFVSFSSLTFVQLIGIIIIIIKYIFNYDIEKLSLETIKDIVESYKK